ncbi:TMEM175 family protein [Fructilactobacillus fructivorans]|uniref:Integral membrane protein n=1 Tax=Fructilactobacillus fructivorans TaxID=1614 RepID=A0A0C1LZV6_9LACO|nr:TMEM175 family protein [Fructilactobacillus fructivorans]KID42405.1 hypothetical protein LfDm3_0334 [Fructilactobacillus fructivorans]MCT0150981.1 DUF1211 domain-containing protein [Fructilactobacillus fructivorans]MCT2867462.1 DUF1211 domain-containing protein [Fructilactobacillus fructivorans]MCT2869020.1 DUF1211 domain-containing protein [Fructilactobacillus fructivorans]MCT2873261.1 DUF1211 domain-containing protein [Fructilactobacillus fructivorans]
MSKSRMEAFDAVMAIIMTVMVLEIKAPDSPHISGMINQIPYFLGYFISATLICICWYNITSISKAIHRVSEIGFAANIFFLLCMSILPVATAWVSHYPYSQTTEYFYFITYIIWTFSFFLLDYVMVRTNKKYFEKTYLRKHKRINLSHIFIEVPLGIAIMIVIYFIPISGIIFTIVLAALWTVFDEFRA